MPDNEKSDKTTKMKEITKVQPHESRIRIPKLGWLDPWVEVTRVVLCTEVYCSYKDY